MLESTLRFSRTREQTLEHTRRLIQSHIDSKIALGTLKEGIDSVQYKLDLLTAVNDNYKEVLKEEIDSLTKQIEEEIE